MPSIRWDKAWNNMKIFKATMHTTATSTSSSRNKATCHYCTFGTTGHWENQIKGHLTQHTLFVLKTMFEELKKVLPHNENLMIENLSRLVTNYPSLKIPTAPNTIRIRQKNNGVGVFTFHCVKKDPNFAFIKRIPQTFRRFAFLSVVTF